MPSMYEKLLTVISKQPESRTDFECQELVPWFKNKSVLFATLKPEIVSDVIRHCAYEHRKKDDVIIKQGENGHSLYIILKGQLSVYVIQDQEDSREVLRQVEDACSRADLDRNKLGQYVWASGEGKTVGEVALLKDDCVRTASVVADCDTDVVVIDRSLYSRSVQDVLEQEYQEKTNFVDTSPMFRSWPTKQKRQLIISLKKEFSKYGSYITRQGAPADNVFFILSGECEITCDQSLFHAQYTKLWKEMESLLPGLLPRAQDVTSTPYESLLKKRVQHKMIQLCLLGSHEIIGVIEILLGMKTYLVNAISSSETEILSLSKENYERLFNRKFAVESVQCLRERMTNRLYMYIYRSESVPPGGASFFKFLVFMVQDENAVKKLKKIKRKEKDEKVFGRLKTTDDMDGAAMARRKGEDDEVSGMLKMLNIRPQTTYGRMPVLESGKRVISEIEEGLRKWVQRTRGIQGD